MRVLGVGNYGDLGSIYTRLAAEGHEVRVHIADVGSRGVLGGLIDHTELDPGLAWVGDGLVLFEDSGWGELQDRLRARGVRVIGGSAFGDRLEEDREAGQQLLRDHGMQTLPSPVFTSFEDAIAHVRARRGRYVLKFHSTELTSDANYVGMLDDGEDVIAMLARHAASWEGPIALSLMAHVEGVETGLGAFFDGNSFVGPINLDWEHKRFFPGDVGELTGEMGTVVTYRGGDTLFAATLARLAPSLRAARHVGYVNLNTIIDERGVWPLELTTRFGYPGFAILSELFAEDCGAVLDGVARGRTFQTHDGFAVGVVLTVPPFPYHHGYDELGKGLPIFIPPDVPPRCIHLGEVARVDGQLVTAGQVGYAMVVTGQGPDVAAAQRTAYRWVRRIAIPNVRYRIDIGDRLRARGLDALQTFGWL